jgi:CubicO group peptidase (beta-lactamase class C family)
MTVRNEIDAALADDFATWGMAQGACALVGETGPVASAGDVDAVLPWASVTKIVAALAVLDAAADGIIDLDAPAGPEGSTIRHLLGHASGLAFDDERVLAAPGVRRIYSNVGIDTAVAAVVSASGAADPARLLTDRVLGPLGMDRTRIVGPAAHGAEGPLADLALLARELLHPRTLRPPVIDLAVTPSFVGLAGVLPGYGRQNPNDWGLGIEVRGRKSPHWMPATVSPAAFGHFGQSGSFVWVDRRAGVSAVALTGVAFGPWAAEAWPRSSARWLDVWQNRRRTA